MVSLLGNEVLDTAIVLWLGLIAADGQSWGPVAAAGAVASSSLPPLLVGTIGGVYADRWDRRRIMLATDAIRGCLILGLALLLLLEDGLPVTVRLAASYTVIALCSVAAQFFNPARYGLLASIVADADRERMGSITAGTAALTAIVGPAIAAGLLLVATVQWSLLLTAAAFAVSFAAVAKVRVDPAVVVSTRVTADESPGMWRDLVDGLRFFAGNRVLMVMLITNVTVVIGTTAVHTLDIFFVTRNLHAPLPVYGFLGTAFGLGALAGAGLAAVFAPRLRAGTVYAYGFMLVGLLLIVYSRMTTPFGAIIVLFFLGIPVAAVSSMIGPLIMRATPVGMIGRVSGVFQPASELATLVSVALVAWLAGSALHNLDTTVAGIHFGTIDTIFLAAGVIITMTALWTARALRGTSTAKPTTATRR